MKNTMLPIDTKKVYTMLPIDTKKAYTMLPMETNEEYIVYRYNGISYSSSLTLMKQKAIYRHE